MNQIADVCLCVPDYVPNVRSIVNSTRLKECNFYEHATCVNYVHYYFDPTIAHCLPACMETTFEQTRIQVWFFNRTATNFTFKYMQIPHVYKKSNLLKDFGKLIELNILYNYKMEKLLYQD